MDKFIRELSPTPNRFGRELAEPLLCYLYQDDSKAAAFGQIVYLEEVHLIVERFQVVAWISLPLIAWYMWHLEPVRKGFLLNLSSEEGVIVVSHPLGSDDKIFNPCSQLV